jgi:glycerophosphoryl diester phosphodiesterase
MGAAAGTPQLRLAQGRSAAAVAGDSVRATKRALRRGADVIEIDVVLVGGHLYGGHERPLPVVGKRVFRGPRLDAVWKQAQRAEAIQLDLKQSSAGFVERLLAFLEDHPHANTIVSTPSMTVVRAFRRESPWVIRLLSVPNEQALARLRGSPASIAEIDGVSIRQSILTEDDATWLKTNRLLILAWVVNDARRLNELVRFGIDAAISDNLAMIELLGGHGRAETSLTTRRER